MSLIPPSPLPLFDRHLLRAVEKIVPAAERGEWSRTWRAELWHMHHRGRNLGTQNFRVIADLSIGLTCDAVWLRTDSWSRALSGTPTLCLVSLLGLCLLSTLIGLVINGSWHALGVYLDGPFKRSILAALLVVFVSFATASRGHIEQTASSKKIHGIKRQVFFAAKASLVILLTFLLSADVCRPIHTPFPNTAGLFQILFFVIMTLVALRWAFRDQEERCKQCLRSLATPARVGRPSHNLLEWNGTGRSPPSTPSWAMKPRSSRPVPAVSAAGPPYPPAHFARLQICAPSPALQAGQRGSAAAPRRQESPPAMQQASSSATSSARPSHPASEPAVSPNIRQP